MRGNVQPKTIFVAIFALSACQCCPRQDAKLAGAREPSLAIKPATRSTTQPAARWSGIMDRLGSWYSLLIQFQESYLINEGYAHRGKYFDRLAGGIDSFHGQRKATFTEYDVLTLLGPPEYGDSDQRGSLFIYLYDRFGHRDWYVRFDFDAKGKLVEVGWNASSEIDLTKYKRFPEWRMIPDRFEDPTP
jgi:hypothetical protein